MNKIVICDTDFLSTLLCVERIDILYDVFPGEIIIPEIVRQELEAIKSSRNSRISWIYDKLENEIKKKRIVVEDIEFGTPEMEEYRLLKGDKYRIGNGEAMTIALVKKHDGLLASNNLRDVQQFVETGEIKNVTTDKLLVRYYRKHKGKITIEEMEGIRHGMRIMGRSGSMSHKSFSELINE